MSGWTLATLRGKKGKNYEYSRWDNHDPVNAVEDLCASVESDDRVRKWTMDSPHVYVYFNCSRYDWDFAEEFLGDYKVMLRDAVVLGANDTSDTGTARYYEGGTRLTDEYKETQGEDGTHVGYMALNVINARHGILARDPWHQWTGVFDERRAKAGTARYNGGNQ